MNIAEIKPEPGIVAETSSYLVLYKAPRMHTAPLRPGEQNNLLAWAAPRYPEIVQIKGRKDIEGGLIHRLDYETHGLVLCARTDEALQSLLEQQESGKIIKEYDALCHNEYIRQLPGFPPLPLKSDANDRAFTVIESSFRPFGKGQKAVRPAENNNPESLYRTEILSCIKSADHFAVCVRINKGFRHQIRCHLSWIGRPILNDPLYGKDVGNNEPAVLPPLDFMALRASAITFTDSGIVRRIAIDS